MDLLVAAGSLRAELIARDVEDFESLVVIILVELFEAGVLRGEAASRSRVHHEHHFTLEISGLDFLAVPRGEREAVESGIGLFRDVKRRTDPVGNLLVRLAHGFAADRLGREHGSRFFRQLLRVAFAVLHPAAAVGEERDYGLAHEVGGSQETRSRGRNRAEPVRGADEDNVVLFEVNRFIRELRMDAALNLFLGLRQTCVVVLRIGVLRLDLDELAAGCFLNLLGEILGVAGFARTWKEGRLCER